MSDFYVAPVFPDGGGTHTVTESSECRRPIDRFRNAVRAVLAQTASGKWRTTLRGVYQK